MQSNEPIESTNKPKAIVDQKGLALSLLKVGREHVEGNKYLREMTRRRPGRVLLDTAGCYLAMLLSFVLLATVDAWWAPVIAFVVIGNRQYALAILAHDGKHGNLLHDKNANSWYMVLALCAPIGIRGEKVKHLTHHDYFGSDQDPDLKLYKVDNKNSPMQFFLFFIGGLTALPVAILRYAQAGKRSQVKGGRGPRRVAASENKQPKGKLAKLTALIADRWPAVTAQALIFAAICTVFPWWYYLAFWIAPLCIMLLIPQKVRMFCEHACMPGNNGDVPQLITFMPNPIEKVVFAPMNINYHAEHHLWPYVPYFNLPHFHRYIVKSETIHLETSYLGFLWRYIRKLPYQSTSPAYASSQS